MRLRTLVLREIFERKSQLLTSFVAILLGITVIVSIKNITHYSEGRDGAGDGLAGGQRAGASQVGHLAGILQRRPAKRHDSRGIRDATGDGELRGDRQRLAQALRARASAGEDSSR